VYHSDMSRIHPECRNPSADILRHEPGEEEDEEEDEEGDGRKDEDEDGEDDGYSE
jgi:hypothetical protein